MLMQTTNSRVLAEMVDPLTGESLQTVWHPIGLSVQGITTMQDISGNEKWSLKIGQSHKWLGGRHAQSLL